MVVFLLVSCDVFTSNYGKDKGNLTIAPGSTENLQQSAAARSVVPGAARSVLPADLTDGFRYVFTFTGPGGQALIRELSPGLESLSLSVTLGVWSIAAQAYASNGVLAGTGSAVVTVGAGQNTVRIPMTVHAGYIEIPPGGAVISISSAAELAGIIGHLTDPAKNYSANAYVLSSDIDLSGFGPWTPIGEVGVVNYYGDPIDGLVPFKGNFYGQGHSIRGLELPGGSGINKIGLFGYAVDARIQDLVVELAPVSIALTSTQTLNVGGILGWSANTHIVNCGVYSNGTIAITGTVSRDLAIGGIAGWLTGGSISGCYASFNLTASNTGTHFDVAGIAMTDSSSSIENC
jgi:hypothetical protein